MKRYVIHWKSKVNGRAGTGTKLFDRNAAEVLVEELNREYPQIEHEILDAARAQFVGENLANASDSPPEPLEMMAAR